MQRGQGRGRGDLSADLRARREDEMRRLLEDKDRAFAAFSQDQVRL